MRRSVTIAICVLACAGAWGQTDKCGPHQHPDQIIALACGALEPHARVQVKACKNYPQPVCVDDEPERQIVSVTPPPTKCGLYKHLEYQPIICTSSGCDFDPYPKCVDDTRIVTEKEWQELMRRLEKLEAQANGQLISPH